MRKLIAALTIAATIALGLAPAVFAGGKVF
jgi:hypothetical protein